LGIRRYREGQQARGGLLDEISALSGELATAADLPAFRKAMDHHESLVSMMLGIPPIKERLFPDYAGSIKSLGAWGGDFILAAGGAETRGYFARKGYATQFGYSDLIL